MDDPARYEAWYHTARGAWIGATEARLIRRLLRAEDDASVLDVGAGTGYFTRRLAVSGLGAVALDPELAPLRLARERDPHSVCVAGAAERLPFADAAFDYCTAITSLCFVSAPVSALQEMWRVSRRGVLLGLLNPHSLLHRRRSGRGGYRSARWDDAAAVRAWAAELRPVPRLVWRTAVFLPDGGVAARVLERLLPGWLKWGGFLAVMLHRCRRCSVP